MLKRLICAVAVPLLASIPAYAETWQFTYTGLFSETENKFVPDYVVRGEFAGSDTDGDGVLEQGELTIFKLYSLEYGLDGPRYCDAGSYCHLQSFSYSASGQLEFTTYWRYSDEGAFSRITTIAGDSVAFTGGNPGTTTRHYWTDQTRFQITPPPVPEPGAPAMLAAGLAVLGARRWWTGKASGNA